MLNGGPYRYRLFVRLQLPGRKLPVWKRQDMIAVYDMGRLR